MTDYTSVHLDGPSIGAKRAMTVAGIRRRHQKEGFDFAEFPRQIREMKDMLPGLDGRLGDPCHPGVDPRDTVYPLWYEWLPEAGAVHSGADAPEFIYEHDQDYEVRRTLSKRAGLLFFADRAST